MANNCAININTLQIKAQESNALHKQNTEAL